MRPGFTIATHSSGLPLPLPMRVSAGFFVIGLSGNTRIQILPPRFTWRVIAMRAASIWRAVSLQRSSAWSPYSPNATVLPLFAFPRMRPFCILRCLTFFGWSIARLPHHVVRRALREGALAQLLVRDVALEDPALHADHAVRRLRLGEAVVDVRAQRVQRHAALGVALAPTHLRAAQPTRGLDADALGAEFERRGHRLLHGAAERHAPLQLERHVLGHELRVELGLADLLDVDEQLALGELAEFLAQHLDLGAALADQDARPRGVDVHHALVARALDHHLRDAGVEELLLDVAAQAMVLVDLVRVVPLLVPVGLPAIERSQPEPIRVYFLTH